MHERAGRVAKHRQQGWGRKLLPPRSYLGDACACRQGYKDPPSPKQPPRQQEWESSCAWWTRGGSMSVYTEI